MKTAMVLGVLLCASQAMAVSFTEDFNTYVAGSLTWGSGGKWNEPTNQLKLDYYTLDHTKGPRTGNSGYRSADAVLSETGLAPLTFSADFYWYRAGCKADSFFIVLSDDPATAAQVPLGTGSLPAPINAIAWGHNATGSKNYSFFDGQKWTVVGFNNSTSSTPAGEVVSGSIDAAGNWTASSSGGGSGGGTLAVSGFAFDTISIISNGNNSGYYSGIDNINITAVPEPATMGLMVLVGLLLARRRR